MAEAIDKYLKGSKFPDDRIDSKEAIEAIKAAGGIPVYAHPIGGEREKRLSEEEVLSRIEALKTQGLMGLECYYSRYSDSDEAMLVGIADRLGLLVSGGSDYHGYYISYPHPLGTCTTPGEALDALLKVREELNK